MSHSEQKLTLSNYSKTNSWYHPRESTCHPWHTALLLSHALLHAAFPFSIPITPPSQIHKTHLLVNSTPPSSLCISTQLPLLPSVTLYLFSSFATVFWKTVFYLCLLWNLNLSETPRRSLPVARVFIWHSLSHPLRIQSEVTQKAYVTESNLRY